MVYQKPKSMNYLKKKNMKKNKFIVKDSGQRQKFNTGAQRDIQAGKGRFDLIPCEAMSRLAKHFENGAKKYGDSNWTKGIPLNRYLDSAFRHLYKFMAGHRDEDHAIAAAWNILCMIETEHMIDIGDLPKDLDNLRKLKAFNKK